MSPKSTTPVGGNAPTPREHTLPGWGRLLRRMLAPSFGLVSAAGFEIRVRGREHFRNRPGTLIVANHKSDFDTIVLIPTLYRTHRGRGPVGRTRFVAAEQMFQPGYVSTYLLARYADGLRRLLYPANLSAVLKALGAYPIPSSRRRKLAIHLRTALAEAGNVPVGEVIRDPVEAVFPGAPVSALLKYVLRWRFHRVLDRSHGVSFFEPDIARKLRAAHLADIEASLAYFTASLNQGDCVFIAPEGSLSFAGQFEGVKAGVSRLATAAQRPVTLLPVNITYDSMTVGRRTAFVSIGPEQVGIEQWPREKIEQRTTEAILRLNTVTLQQLVARALDGRVKVEPCPVDERTFRCGIFDQARSLSLRGLAVDGRLLEAHSFGKRWQRFVRYCERRGLARRHGRQLTFAPDSLASHDGGERDRLAGWRFSANEIHSAMTVAERANFAGEQASARDAPVA